MAHLTSRGRSNLPIGVGEYDGCSVQTITDAGETLLRHAIRPVRLQVELHRRQRRDAQR